MQMEEHQKAVVQLCRLAAAGDPGLLGAQRCRLPRVWQLATAATLSSFADKAAVTGTAATASMTPIRAAVAEMARQLAAALPPDDMRRLWQGMDPIAAAELQKALTGQ